MQVIDTSAIVKYFSREEGWQALDTAITEGYTISLAFVELGNALLNKLAHEEISRNVVGMIIDIFSSEAILLNQNKYLMAAFDIANRNKITFYDSIFIAVAIGEGCDLVTCDKKQAEIGRRLGLSVIAV